MRAVLFAALLLPLAVPAGATDFYSSPQGDDSGVGSQAAPFKTAQRGVAALGPGDALFLRAGTYAEALQVTRSGTVKAPITLRAYPGEAVWLDGARAVPGPWAIHAGKIYQAPWPVQPAQVFCDGHLLNEARWPLAEVEGLSHQSVARTDAGSASMVVCRALPPVDLTGALIQVMPGQSWCAYTRGIARHDLGSGTLSFDSPIQALGALVPRRGDRFYVFGKLDLLRGPGQWYWDPVAQLLYVWAQDGASPAGRAEAGEARALLTLDGQSYIQVHGLCARGGSFSLRQARHCSVEDCELWAPNWTRRSNGYGTLRSAAVEISGQDDQVLGGSIHETGLSGVLLAGQGHKVQGVTFEDGDWNWGDAASIQADGADHCDIWDCTVRRVARAAIVQYRSGPLRILRNRLEQVALYSDDIGAFDSWGTDGQGTEIAYNLCRDNQAMWGGGIYLDDHSRNFYVHDNLIQKIKWHGIIFKDINRIEDNTLLDAGHVGIFCAPSLDKDQKPIPLASWDLKGARVAHNRVWEALPLRISLASPSVADYGYYGGYAMLGRAPGRVELDWERLDQPWWALTLPPDLSRITAVTLSMDRVASFDYSVASMRLLPLGKSGDEGAVPLRGSWFAKGGSGSSAALSLQGPAAGGAKGESVQGGWNVLGLALPKGGMDLSAYRGLAFELAGKATVTYAAHGCEDIDNGPEAEPGRGATLPEHVGAD